ncbi:MAG: DUF192 domain-containing protein [Okeania sp. SIO2F4]|uniref:DUF192 domain-containing protein n=1 Tax=Okeania sp. SIO2F4 TaxID=2607790 RepID=UPI00142B6ACD|nr:DUF192 domain-containing protein [Okeania sp. SIO2F4]NES01796.1 DUF192 domain-containing protein [Okeania sp. SIO2F4]
MTKKNLIAIAIIFCAVIIYGLNIYLTSNSNSSKDITKPQYLPITAEININGSRIGLEVADTPKKRQTGLMFRSSLPSDRGMLFIFEPPERVRFWMKNCSYYLDIIFIKEGVVQSLVENAPPCNLGQCPVYDSIVVVDRVIELKGGRIGELGLEVGERLE